VPTLCPDLLARWWHGSYMAAKWTGIYQLSRFGECCICGVTGKLTFEHVPPRAAFNDKRIFEAHVQSLLAGKWAPGSEITEGRYAQRGAGRYSLCGKCNNDTGGWYGTSYVDFVQQAMVLLHASQGTLSLAYPYDIYPLRVLKQIIVMFFSACGPDLRKAHPDLVRFVLNRDVQELPPKIQFWAYMPHPTESTAVRQAGITGRLFLGRKSHVFSEIAFPPFGLIMSMGDAPDARLANLTHFRERKFRQREIAYLKMPVFPVVSFFPGDFRTVEELNETAEKNRRLGSYHFNLPAA
jgi:hypothetical protein